MSDDKTTSDWQHNDQPVDELIRRGRELGADVPGDASRDEARAILNERLELIDGLDRAALLDLASWAGVPVQENATNEILVRRIVTRRIQRHEALSERGLHTLARIRNVSAGEDEPRAQIERRLRRAGGLRAAWRRKRRSIVGSVLSRVLEKPNDSTAGYDSPKPEDATSNTLKKRIEAQGVVTGLTETLRGAADDYVARKLDEIELRVDRKLDEIDRRLGEWRDREIANRLRILKITLVFSILVAGISLGYDYLRSHLASGAVGSTQPASNLVTDSAEAESPGQTTVTDH